MDKPILAQEANDRLDNNISPTKITHYTIYCTSLGGVIGVICTCSCPSYLKGNCSQNLHLVFIDLIQSTTSITIDTQVLL